MRINLVDTIPDATVEGIVGYEGPAMVREIVLVYEGTMDAGKDIALDDLDGQLIISHHGGAELGDIVSLGRPEFMVTFCEANGGRTVVQNNVDESFTMILRIPFHLKDDRNGLYLAPNERLQIEVPPLDDTDIDETEDCTVQVYAILGDAVTRYIPRVHDRRIDLGGIRKEHIPEGTAVIILTCGSTTNPDRITVLRGEQRLTYVDWDGYYALWQTVYDQDDAPTLKGDQYLDWTQCGRHLSDALGVGQVLELVQGSGHLDMFTYSLDYHVPSRTVQSAQFQQTEITRAAARLKREGVESAQIPVLLPAIKAAAPIQKSALAVQPPQVFPRIRRQPSGFGPI